MDPHQQVGGKSSRKDETLLPGKPRADRNDRPVERPPAIQVHLNPLPPHDLPSTIVRPSRLCLRRGSKACGFRIYGSSRGAGGCSSPCRIHPRGWPLLRALFCPVLLFSFLFLIGTKPPICLLTRGDDVGRLSRACHAGARPCRCPSVNQTARAVVKGRSSHGRQTQQA
ncbi:uncharacterized protein BO88DRAFT_149837 [Aspergillus vadensis CBS 113365]|uniref:Uncharacterized protein n=1 Tax=Aspergillus vadensis (strain CBS 113365 / IMI 142717 / IBT 24658) TaxID=1448311 RepID=A0A319C8H2_ASPVC|nr:hypothetical protein BO88DRAFT_149837 [Aspergillus vadensis CBS 113365]PYH65032.1 hypothetical protein BO88DRAFT_149837 [Aspergillus vadensis CBS 113365]